jgi:TRAP-type C4-dicarboxylate transport system permease large subunit
VFSLVEVLGRATIMSGLLLVLSVAALIAALKRKKKLNRQAEAAPLRALIRLKIDAYKNEEKLREAASRT